MPKHYDNSYVVCPFFRFYDRQNIACEGIENKTAIHIVFNTQQRRLEYMKKRCYNEYKKCYVAQTLLNYKYGEKE